jgi:hypothetical protein
MIPFKKNRRTAAALRVFVQILGVAIFAWGLHGKLNQYKTPTPSRQASVVKLIQDDEASKNTCIPRHPQKDSSSRLAHRNPAEPLQQRFIMRRNRQVRTLVSSAIPSYPHSLLFRPPPSNA